MQVQVNKGMSRILLPSKWTNAVQDRELRKKLFRRFGPQLNKGGGGGPLPWIRHCNVERKFGEIVQIPCKGTSCM